MSTSTAFIYSEKVVRTLKIYLRSGIPDDLPRRLTLVWV